jgi:hypothetical protein
LIDSLPPGGGIIDWILFDKILKFMLDHED